MVARGDRRSDHAAMARHERNRRRRDAAAAPQPGQLSAIDRLIREERLDEAEARLEELVDQFPRVSAVHQRYIAVLEELAAGEEAALAALEWTRLIPGSLQAWRSAARI